MTTLKDALRKEVAGVALGDERRNRRYAELVTSLGERAGQTLPQAMSTSAELEAAYRFFSNDAISHDALARPHVEETVGRCRDYECVFAVSDTTEFAFTCTADREGLGYLQGNRRGFHGHFCIAVSADGTRRPLGLLAWEPMIRGQEPKRRKNGPERARDPQRESKRWGRIAHAAEASFDDGQRVRLVHLMDREADDFNLLASFIERGAAFVVRVKHDRALEASDVGRLFAAMEASEAVLCCEIPLSERRRSTKERAPRKARMARLRYSSMRATIRRPATADKDTPASLTLNFVHVTEIDAPQDEEPVDWKIVTSESIDSAEDILRIIEAYRARWTVEEYFKAIKTGCAYEKAQLESLDALLNYLVTLLPVAWQLLLLRAVSRDAPDAPAETVLDSLQLEVLRAMARTKLPDNPTVSQAVLAVAGLGGHITNNGPPGWLVLGRGFKDLCRCVEVWKAAGAHKSAINR